MGGQEENLRGTKHLDGQTDLMLTKLRLTVTVIPVRPLAPPPTTTMKTYHLATKRYLLSVFYINDETVFNIFTKNIGGSKIKNKTTVGPFKKSFNGVA